MLREIDTGSGSLPSEVSLGGKIGWRNLCRGPRGFLIVGSFLDFMFSCRANRRSILLGQQSYCRGFPNYCLFVNSRFLQSGSTNYDCV